MTGATATRTPPVSVIVPAFNAASTIAPCVESILSQSRPPKEIIIVDDGSTDETLDAVAEYPVRVFRLTDNRGPGVARNVGASHARHDILAFTDSDCVARQDWLEILLAELSRGECVAVTGGYAGASVPEFQHLVLRHRQSTLPAFLRSTITSNFLCRRDAFRAVNGFPIYTTVLRRFPSLHSWDIPLPRSRPQRSSGRYGGAAFFSPRRTLSDRAPSATRRRRLGDSSLRNSRV